MGLCTMNNIKTTCVNILHLGVEFGPWGIISEYVPREISKPICKDVAPLAKRSKWLCFMYTKRGLCDTFKFNIVTLDTLLKYGTIGSGSTCEFNTLDFDRTPTRNVRNLHITIGPEFIQSELQFRHVSRVLHECGYCDHIRFNYENMSRFHPDAILPIATLRKITDRGTICNFEIYFSSNRSKIPTCHLRRDKLVHKLWCK